MNVTSIQTGQKLSYQSPICYMQGIENPTQQKIRIVNHRVIKPITDTVKTILEFSVFVLHYTFL